MGVYAGGAKGDGGIGETGGRERESGISAGNGEKRHVCGERRTVGVKGDVHVSDLKYFILTADSGEYDCV